VRHAVENVLSGEYRSAFRGRGMEFDQVVKYEFGDDVRDIDWNVTARLGEPYRKKFVEEREVTLLLVFEDSPSLHFGSGAQSKREALLELAGLVMLLGAVNRDRVGFVHASPTGTSSANPCAGAARSSISGPLLASGAGAGPPEAARHRNSLALPRPRRAQAQRVDLARRFSARAGRPRWRSPRAGPCCSAATRPWASASTTRGSAPCPRARVSPPTTHVAGRLVVLDGNAAERAAHADVGARTRRGLALRCFPIR
jgi:hypothetical protein